VGREITRGCHVLTDRREREAYDERIGTDYGQDRRVALKYIFDAEDEYLQGAREMEDNQWANALACFTRAAEANPRDPEYLAAKGWSTYQALKAGQSTDSFAPNKARNTLERALSVDQRHQKAMLYLARLEKDMGNLEASRSWFERLHKMDPANDEVVAALDWLRSYSSSPGRPDDSAGVWNRFKGMFKKK